jgi:L-lysine 6-transaminase
VVTKADIRVRIETHDPGARHPVAPPDVHETLRRTMLVEGYPVVFDPEKSRGQYLHDALSGRDYLDFFTFYASRPLAFDHPKLLEPAYVERLHLAARTKPSNGDIYTVYLAEFVKTFEKLALGPGMKHLFFVDGGALAVENALKAAFDWKAQKNRARGRGENPGQVVHFTHAFHGRSGYTMSLTNTADPRKTALFPKFDWPRIPSPAIHHPLEGDNITVTAAREAAALAEIDAVYARLGEESLACIIIEPIQAEGGDRHFRRGFLERLRKICDEREALLIFDEVQTGGGATGTMWHYEQLGVVPDIVAFAKKLQTGGIMAGPRLDEVESVFEVKSRISSTFGGNLVDFVRATRYLEIIREDELLDNVEEQGAHLLYEVTELCSALPRTFSAPRGAGLLVAMDVETPELRDRIIKLVMDDGLIILPCGERSIRFRPALDVGRHEIDEALHILRGAIKRI